MKSSKKLYRELKSREERCENSIKEKLNEKKIKDKRESFHITPKAFSGKKASIELYKMALTHLSQME